MRSRSRLARGRGGTVGFCKEDGEGLAHFSAADATDSGDWSLLGEQHAGVS